MSCFNPRTRVGCDDGTAWEIGFAYAFQSTHPRGVRRVEPDQPVPQSLVSIHAPAWGATPRNEAAFPAAPCFNPRTRVGYDIAANFWPEAG